VFRLPQRVTIIVCGTLGTILGLGIYQHFMTWIDQIATVVPPLIGPVIVDYYVFNGRRYDVSVLDRLPAWNPVAVAAVVAGIVAAYAFTPPWIASGLFGLLVSMAAYLVFYLAARALGVRPGYAGVASRG
jgi:cytosine permease